jgi:hypothetical protein
VADAEWFLDEMLTIYPVLGVDAFDLPKVSGVDVSVLHLEGDAAKGTGIDEPEGFLVYQGSLARVAEAESFRASMSALRAELVVDGIFVLEGKSYRLTQNYRFSSPSTAAGVLLGRSANGREEWKNEGGVSLKELQDAALT